MAVKTSRAQEGALTKRSSGRARFPSGRPPWKKAHPPRPVGYYMDVDASLVGTWWSGFYSTGTGQAAEETKWVVNPSERP